MKIGLLSDTHGYFEEAWELHLGSCDEIWHAGDFGTLAVAQGLLRWAPLRGVYGNIDGPEIRQIYPEHLHLEVEGVRIWMTHIGGQPKRYPAAIKKRLQTDPPDVFICGHSHILRAEKDPFGVLHLNPGACGRQGFHLVRTLMLMEIENGKFTSFKVVELGPR